MAADVTKLLDRAKKFLEKNRVEDAIEAYQSVLQEAPHHVEATQALGDLYTRVDLPDRAAVYYGYLFDILIEPKDETKALAIFNRFLKNSHVAATPGTYRALCLSAAKAKSSRRSDGAVHESGGNVCAGGPRRRCAVLLGADGTDRP